MTDVRLTWCRVGDRYLASLDRMLERSALGGVPVVIVDLPVPADLDTRLFPDQFAAYRSALAKAAAARDVPVLWATRDAVELTDADCADLVHVNGNGAARLSRWVREAISRGVDSLSGEPEATAAGRLRLPASPAAEVAR